MPSCELLPLTGLTQFCKWPEMETPQAAAYTIGRHTIHQIDNVFLLMRNLESSQILNLTTYIGCFGATKPKILLAL